MPKWFTVVSHATQIFAALAIAIAAGFALWPYAGWKRARRKTARADWAQAPATFRFATGTVAITVTLGIAAWTALTYWF
jgi:hypothetical protein